MTLKDIFQFTTSGFDDFSLTQLAFHGVMEDPKKALEIDKEHQAAILSAAEDADDADADAGRVHSCTYMYLVYQLIKIYCVLTILCSIFYHRRFCYIFMYIKVRGIIRLRNVLFVEPEPGQFCELGKYYELSFPRKSIFCPQKYVIMWHKSYMLLMSCEKSFVWFLKFAEVDNTIKKNI